MAVRSYRELFAWQRAMDLAEAVYECSKGFPREEMFGLTSQIRRAAVSIASNIAEGQGRGAGAEFKYHLRVSRGSLQEMETQILLAERFGYMTAVESAHVLQIADEVSRLCRRLYESL